MSIDDLKAALPAYAKDLKLNLSSVLKTPGLTEQQLWGTALASALAARNGTVIRAISAAAHPNLSDEAVSAAKTAAAIMGMNNVYYRFVHLASDKNYATMPARLRMNAIAQPGIEPIDFELFSLAVSAINGCGMCIDSHEQVIVKKGVSREVIQDVVRIASVVHAIAATLDAEEKLAA